MIEYADFVIELIRNNFQVIMPILAFVSILIGLWSININTKRNRLIDNKRAVKNLINFIHQNVIHLDFGHYKNDARGIGSGASKGLKMTLFQVADLADYRGNHFTNENLEKDLKKHIEYFEIKTHSIS